MDPVNERSARFDLPETFNVEESVVFRPTVRFWFATKSLYVLSVGLLHVFT